jgi:hypothetical protein
MGGTADDLEILYLLFSIVMSCFAQTAPDIRQRLPGKGRSNRSAQMSKAKQFLEFADEAFQWSRKAKTEAARQILLGLAFTWIQAALISERAVVGPRTS